MIRIAILLITVVMFIGCTPRVSEEKASAQLKVLLDDDLETIIADLKKSDLIEKPYYTINSFSGFDEGKYRYLAEVDYFFLKGVNEKIVRKYRYYLMYQKWERYINEYQKIE
jgi:hypothetical protein